MAYILGFFVADGCMFKNKRGACFIEFANNDRSILEKIKEKMHAQHMISQRDRKMPNQAVSFRLQLGSKILFEDLRALGMTPHKSKTVNLPDVPAVYFADFVRGYFDGDGSVTMGSYRRATRQNNIYSVLLAGFTSGSPLLLHSLHDRLKEFAGIVGGTLHYNKGYRLYFAAKDSSCLYNFMYNRPTDLYLERKKIVFEKYFKMRYTP